MGVTQEGPHQHQMLIRGLPSKDLNSDLRRSVFPHNEYKPHPEDNPLHNSFWILLGPPDRNVCRKFQAANRNAVRTFTGCYLIDLIREYNRSDQLTMMALTSSVAGLESLPPTHAQRASRRSMPRVDLDLGPPYPLAPIEVAVDRSTISGLVFPFMDSSTMQIWNEGREVNVPPPGLSDAFRFVQALPTQYSTIPRMQAPSYSTTNTIVPPRYSEANVIGQAVAPWDSYTMCATRDAKASQIDGHGPCTVEGDNDNNEEKDEK